MTRGHYVKQPMQLVELRINMIIAKLLHLMNSLERNVSDPLIRKYSNIPIIEFYMYITTITDENDNITFTKRTNFQNEDKDIIFKYLLILIPSSILLFSLTSSMIYT